MCDLIGYHIPTGFALYFISNSVARLVLYFSYNTRSNALTYTWFINKTVSISKDTTLSNMPILPITCIQQFNE